MRRNSASPSVALPIGFGGLIALGGRPSSDRDRRPRSETPCRATQRRASPCRARGAAGSAPAAARRPGTARSAAAEDLRPLSDRLSACRHRAAGGDRRHRRGKPCRLWAVAVAAHPDCAACRCHHQCRRRGDCLRHHVPGTRPHVAQGIYGDPVGHRCAGAGCPAENAVE